MSKLYNLVSKWVIEISFISIFILDTLTIVITGIFGGLLVLAILVIFWLFIRRRQAKKLGEAIENEININTKYHQIRREAKKAIQQKDYRKNVIYNAFAFRIICHEYYTIRNGRIIPFDDLISKLKGSPDLNLKEINQLVEIYEKARFTSNDISYNDSQKVEQILSRVIQKLEIKVDDL